MGWLGASTQKGSNLGQLSSFNSEIIVTLELNWPTTPGSSRFSGQQAQMHRYLYHWAKGYHAGSYRVEVGKDFEGSIK